MKTLTLAAFFVASTAFAQTFELKGNAEKGKQHYTMMCVSCHGEKGDGNGPAAAALTPKPGDFTSAADAARLTPEWVYKMVKSGGAANGKSPLMVSWAGALDDQGLRDVSAYVLTFKPAPPPPAPEAPAKKPGKKK